MNTHLEKVFCVISHTHWDREWYMPFEQFRFKLVDLMDNLLDVLAEYPRYIFHLDAQTIVLEDYLEIRPYRKEKLKELIGEGRLLVGPWYVQNDFYLTSGEATIRNLLVGSRIAGDYGKCSWVGYTPDQFGLISQLPQIFNGFGVDNCIFGRGYSMHEDSGSGYRHVMKPSEFVWKGPDDSEVLAVNLPYWYNNAQRFSEDPEKSMKLLEKIEKDFEGIALTPYLLLMNGVDHLEAQENLLPILEKLNSQLPEGKTVRQLTMPEYINKVKEYTGFHRDGAEAASKTELPIYTGELRNGEDYHILQGTLSSRIYLKTANVKAQNLLENRIEPVYSFLSMLGAGDRYPADYLTFLWKLLLQNHPHDSICGCSRDEIHAHMEDRFDRIQEAGGELLRRGMDFITAHVDRSGLTDGDYLISLFNTCQTARSTVLDAELQFPVTEEVKAFTFADAKGNQVPYTLLKKVRKNRDVFSAINLPGSIEVDSYQVQLFVPEIEGMSYKTLVVKPVKECVGGSMTGSPASWDGITLPARMENEKLLVTIASDGQVDLTYKETGRRYADVLQLEDSEDFGDSYVYKKAANGRTITTAGLIPEIQCIRRTEWETQYKLTYRMELPDSFDRNSGVRSEKLVSNKAEIMLGLKTGSSWLDVAFDLENASKDHRLRVLLKTGMKTDYTYGEAPFDLIRRDRRDVLKGICNGTQPNSGSLDIHENGEGIAVLNCGIHEYEHLLDEAGTLALTLLRANGRIVADDGGDTWQVPGNQCLRQITLHMAILPHGGDTVSAGVLQQCRAFLNPVMHYFQPADVRKFSGGRPAVQDSAIKEIFFRKDPYGHIVLPLDKQLMDIRGNGIVVTALKKSETGDCTVIRVYNAGEAANEFALEGLEDIQSVQMLNLKEEPLIELKPAGNTLGKIVLNPKEIVTLGLR